MLAFDALLDEEHTSKEQTSESSSSLPQLPSKTAVKEKTKRKESTGNSNEAKRAKGGILKASTS